MLCRPCRDARDAAAARQIRKRVQHRQQGHAAGHLLDLREDFVHRRARGGEPGSFEHDEALCHGGIAGIDEPDVQPGRLGLASSIAWRAESYMALNCLETVMQRTLSDCLRRAPDRLQEHPRDGAGPWSAAPTTTQELVELCGVVSHAVRERPTGKDQVQRHDPDAVPLRQLGGHARGAIGDDGRAHWM